MHETPDSQSIQAVPPDFWGLRDFSLEAGPGVTGLLGPNGAGKSTLMRMLATITQPTEGTILWDDVDIVRTPGPLHLRPSWARSPTAGGFSKWSM